MLIERKEEVKTAIINVITMHQHVNYMNDMHNLIIIANIV